MATWVCPGREWTTGLSLPCEAQFVQLNGSPKLSYMGPACENKRKENTQSEKASGVTRVHIMTFPAYCRYMALKKRMSEGACFTMKQILSLGGMVASNRTTKMVFCRESFHYPSLEKFELSIENKAPVLKGRPRKKKRLKIENSANKVVRNRFLTEINGNQLDIDSPKSKVSDDDLGTDSDVSEASCQSTETCRPKKVNAVIEKNFVASVNIQLPVSKSQASGPPPLQPSIKAHVPRLIPMTPVRLNSTAEPAVKAIMNLESKPPPLVKSDFQPKLTTAVTTVTISAVKSDHMQQQSSFSSMSTSSSSVISMSKQTMSYTTTVTMATKVPVSASNVTSLQKISKEPIVGQPVQGLETVQSKESRQPRLIKAREDNRVIKVEEQGKENVEMEKKTRKRLREPGDFSDIESCENEDEKFFMKSLRDFMKSRNTPLGKIPALGFKKVNLWTMYNATQKLGGYEMVTSKRQWRDVYDSLGGSTTITSAATYTRRHYEKLLLPYERYVRGQLSATSNDCEHETKLTKDRPTMQKHKDITQPSSKTTFSNQKVPIKKEMSEVAVQREPVKTMSRQPDQAKPVKSNYHQDISHNPKLVSCSQSLQQHQPKLQSQGILLRVPKPQENTTVVPEIKKIKVERLEHCVGTAPSVSVGNAISKRKVIDLTEAEESGNRKDQPRVPHRPSSHANLTNVPTTVTNLVRDHPQAERPKSRGIVSQVHQPSMRTQRKNGKLSAGELKAVADEHFKTQVTARQLSDGVQQHKETRSVNVSQIERYQPNQVVRTKEKLRNPDQKFELQESEGVHCESVPGLKRRVSRMSPSEHVKKRRFVKQPLQVSVDDHFEQWRRRTQEVQTKPQSVASPRGHPSSKGKPSTQVVPTSRSVVSSHSTAEAIVGQERAVTPQYSRSSYGSEIRASVTTDSHARSSPIVVADSLKKQSQCRAREKQHVNTNSTKPVKESHKTSYHGQDNRLQVKESQYIKSEGGNHLHEQRHVPQDSHCHVSHSNTQVTFQASSNRAQRMLVKAKDELPTPEFYPVMVNTEDLSSRPPSLEMEMGDVFPSASSYVGTHFYPAPWAPTGEFLEYPAQGGYQLVAAATAADKMGQCSSSRIFMPPSIFPPMGTMPPLSPSLLAPGHLVASPDSTELRIHPHCMLGSFPVPCTHQMASATTNFPLLQG